MLTLVVIDQSATAGTPLNMVQVASFALEDVAGSKSTDFAATIKWGDGSQTTGAVQPQPLGNGFEVLGTHTYLTPTTAGSRDPLTVTLTGLNSTTAVAVGQAAVLSTVFQGGLDASGENGPSAALGYSDTNRPTFAGQAAPFALVQLSARRIDLDATLPLGQTIADGSGRWTLSTDPLSEGIFQVSGTVTPPGGTPVGPLPLGNPGLFTIDTIPPRLVGVSSDRLGRVLVSFQDDLSGMNLATLADPGQYTLWGQNGSAIHAASATVLPNAGLPGDVVEVRLTLGGGPRFRPKALRITALGIADNSGNALGHAVRHAIAAANGRASSNIVTHVTVHRPKPSRHR